jgi:hypothetical protein
MTQALLQKAYDAQSCITPRHREHFGAFYTPSAVALKMADTLLSPCVSWQQLKTSKVLDPAIGSGIFFLSLLQTIKQRFSSVSGAELLEFAVHNFIGYDLDQKSVELTRNVLSDFFKQAFNLKIKAAQFKNISAANFLDAAIEPQDIQFCIANPPYGLARGGKIEPEENEILKAEFKADRVGKLNKYILFLAKSYRSLSATGRLCFLIPNAWTGVEAAERSRRTLLEESALEEIEELAPNLFPEAGVETICITVQKGSNHKSVCLKPIGKPAQYMPYAVALTRSHADLPISWTPTTEALHTNLRANCLPLSSGRFNLRPYIALQAYARGKGKPPQSAETVKTHAFHAFHKDKAPDWYPYLEGKDVTRYEFNWSGLFVHYGPWLAEHQPLQRYLGPRVVIREILAKPPYALRAAYLDKPYVYNRSLLHILPAAPGQELSLKALVAILNSKLGNQIFALVGRKSHRRLFPKVLNRDLMQFPLPQDFASKCQRLAELHDALVQSQNRRDELEEQIEVAVNEIYRLG